MKPIFLELTEAAQGPVPIICPLKEALPKGHPGGQLPELARKLVPVWHKHHQVATRLAQTSGNDGGVWFRRHNEAESILTLIKNMIRQEKSLPLRANIDLHADWQYSVNGI